MCNLCWPEPEGSWQRPHCSSLRLPPGVWLWRRWLWGRLSQLPQLLQLRRRPGLRPPSTVGPALQEAVWHVWRRRGLRSQSASLPFCLESVQFSTLGSVGWRPFFLTLFPILCVSGTFTVWFVQPWEHFRELCSMLVFSMGRVAHSWLCTSRMLTWILHNSAVLSNGLLTTPDCTWI